MRNTVWVLVFILSANVRADVPNTAEPLSLNIDLAITEVYRPFHIELARAGEQLQSEVESLCNGYTEINLQTARNQFTEFVYQFARVEYYRVGPMMEDNRKNRLFYWPDKRRVGERQMRTLLNSNDAALLNVEQLSGKSVALQGLPAFERLLYAKSIRELLVQSDASVECGVLQAIAGNMYSMVNAMSQGWLDDTGVAGSMSHPESESVLFRSQDEVLRSLVTQIVVGLDLIADQKLEPLTNSPDSVVRGAPLWKSQQLVPMLAGNLESVRALLLDTGLAGRTGLDAELSFEFRTIATLLQRLQQLPTLRTPGNQLTLDAFSLFRSLGAVVKGIRYTVNDRFMASLGVSAGFNSEDGD